MNRYFLGYQQNVLINEMYAKNLKLCNKNVILLIYLSIFTKKPGISEISSFFKKLKNLLHVTYSYLNKNIWIIKIDFEKLILDSLFRKFLVEK